jgi:hypothetical protein
LVNNLMGRTTASILIFCLVAAWHRRLAA